MMDRVDLRAWLGQSRARDEERAPVVGYRVGVAAGDTGPHRYTDLASANALAVDHDGAACLEPAYLRIERPFVESPDDALVDLGTVAAALGDDGTRRLVATCAQAIEATGSFEPFRHAYAGVHEMAERASEADLATLAVPVEALVSDAAAVQALATAGFDGAIFGDGSQQQWVIFDPQQARPAIAAGWPVRPRELPHQVEARFPKSTYSSVAAVRSAVEELIGTGGDTAGQVVVTTSGALHQRLRGTTIAPAEALLRVSSAASTDLADLMREQAARRKRAVTAIGDVGDCAIVCKPGQARWMMILRDAGSAGQWRTQSFDEDGFSGHMTFADRAQAIANAAQAGFTQRDDQALDRLQDTPRFRRGLLAAELMQEHNAGEISFAEVHRRLQEHDRVAAVLASISEQHAQALCDLQTGSIFLLADRITAGHEAAVLFHELMHKHGRSALGDHGWGRLVGHLRSWRRAPVGSPEHLIYLAADARAQRAGRGDGTVYDEELFSYAVEEAVLRGFKPSAQAAEGSVEQWLDDVESTLRGVLMQLTQKPLQPLSGQQLVDLAYAIAQMESPQRADLIQQRLGSTFEGVLQQAEALARPARRTARSGTTPDKPVRLSNQAVGAAVRRMVHEARNDLLGVLDNWKQAELSADDERIVAHPGRDGAFSRGADGGTVTLSKREFLEWLAGPGPFDAEAFGAEIGADAEWRAQIERLRQLAFPGSTIVEATLPPAPRQSLAPVSWATSKLLRTRGEQVASMMDAQRRWADGERLFVFHEMEDRPSEVRSLLDLHGYVPDQVMALPVPDAPKLTDTPGFKAWFGDWQDRFAHSSKYPQDKTPVSMAVQEDGSPRVMFHATNGDFDVFVTGRPTTNSTTFGPVETQRHAIFATPEVAFAQEHLRGTNGGNVLPVYLDVKSPADLREGVPGDIISEIVARTSLRHADFYHLKPTDTWQLFDGDFGQQVVAALKAAGYDGAILLEVGRDRQAEHEVWAVFEPTQVKSAIGNTGQFNRQDPDIRHSAARDADTAGDRHYLRWKKAEEDLQRAYPVKLHLAPGFDPEVMVLYSIDAHAPGSGAGCQVLRELTRLADEMGTRIELLVDAGDSEERLARWYAEFGFHALGEGRMARAPGAPVTRPAWNRDHADVRLSAPAPPVLPRPLRLAAAVEDAASSPAFRNWFEDSAVIDAAGWPLPVFHGTTRSFARFSTAKLGEKTGALDARTGFFFAENPDAAAQFTWEGGEPYGGNVMPVYLRLTNPLVVRDLLLDGSTGTRAGTLMARAKAAGHDGVIFERSDMLGRTGRAFAVFSPEQVKSVTGNRGTWSPRNSDIRLSVPATADGRRPAWWQPPRDAEFHAWFEDSTVRRPVFHATGAADFHQFNTLGSDLGSHFGSLEQALHITSERLCYDHQSPRIVPVWLQLKNPLRLKDEGSFHADGIAPQLERRGLLAKGEGERIRKECDADRRARKEHDERLRQVIKAAGYDGVVYSNKHEGGGDSYIVFEPKQIRTAIDARQPRPRVLAVHTYPPEGVQHPVRSYARGLKIGDAGAIEAAAREMAALVPAGCTLVPVPSSQGGAEANVALAQRVAEIAGVRLADVLEGPARPSQYAAKKAGKPMAASQMPMRLRAGATLPSDPVLLDNVAGTGETLRAARLALGCDAPGLVYAAVPGLEATHDVRMAPPTAPRRPAPMASGTADDPFDFAADPAFHHLFFATPSAKEVRAFASWLRARPDAFVRLYHGTAARNAVMDQGLLPASSNRRNSLQSSSGFVCASVYPGHAHRFGVMSALNAGPTAAGHRVAVYPVVTTLRRLCADLDQLCNVRAAGADCGNSLAESLAYGHGARMRGRIEPYALRAPRMFRTCRPEEEGEQLHVNHRDRDRLAA